MRPNEFYQNLRSGYLIVGSGKVAKHLSRYLLLKSIDHILWSRAHSNLEDLHQLVPLAGRILLAVSDSAIEEVFGRLTLEDDQVAVHFSGALSFVEIAGVHPLVSFSGDLFDLNFYQKVHFAVDEGVSFTGLFPELKNPHFVIKAEQKALYHAQLVLKASSEYLLSSKLDESFEQMDWPKQGLEVFLSSLRSNALAGQQPTGPIFRKDELTITKNLNALQGSSLRGIYEALVSASAESEQKNKDASDEEYI
jgi:predicted short-subunit dehydrogenase-like oxidoreductase (DUF2520 family)